jgi:hypothetical protein
MRQATVVFTIGKNDGTFGWGSGFACFPNTKVIFTCAHNFTNAIPRTVVARHASTDARFSVPNVVFSEHLDCALAILHEPLKARPLKWAKRVQNNQGVLIHDYVQGTRRNRASTAAEGTLTHDHLVGTSTEKIIKGAIWVGSNRPRDVRVFAAQGIHAGLSGSSILNSSGAVVGQVADSLNLESSVNSHLLQDLKAEASCLYEKVKRKGFI